VILINHKFYLGNVLEVIKHLPEKSVQCCPTSPPYFGLRDYGLPATDWPEIVYTPMAGLPQIIVPAWSGCLGLESTPELYIAHIVLIYREVWRVLRDDGTCFLNIGDSYSGSGKGFGALNHGKLGKHANEFMHSKNIVSEGLKAKDLIGIPWRLAFALQADGWYLRSDIIWEKPNAMPESVTDRPTKSHEYMFLLAKSQKYYYDAEAIKEPAAWERWGKQTTQKRNPGTMSWVPDKSKEELSAMGKKNKRTVWRIPTKPFKGAHYAVFPPDLIEPCILAGTSPQACPVCGAPWRRVITKTGHINRREEAHCPNNCSTKTDSTGWQPTTIGTDELKPTCTCTDNDGSGKCIVLDQFGGSGTVAMKARELGRDSIYIDMSPNYLGDALKRCEVRKNDFKYDVCFMG